MDYKKVGSFIKMLRIENNMTQKQLADKLMISDKAISKWERGLGCPDVSFLSELAYLLNTNVENLLQGEADTKPYKGENMKNSKFYVCPICSGISISNSNAQITCCGRKLEPLEMKKAEEDEKLNVEQIENDWYITSNHEMTKENYISFVAFITGDKMKVFKQYPEWSLQVRFTKREYGILVYYSTDKKLVYQYI